MSQLTIIRPVLATVQYPGIYTGFGQSGLAVSGDPTSWTPGRAYKAGQLVRSTRVSSYGSAGSGVSFNQANRIRAAELNNPDPSLRYELTYDSRGTPGTYDGLNNIYVALRDIPSRSRINPDEEHLRRNDPLEPTYFRRNIPGQEGYIEPYYAFVSKVFQHSFTDETPSNANGLRNRLVIDMICTDAIDTVALIGITGTDARLQFRPASGSGELPYDQTVQLSSAPASDNWGDLVSQEPSYAVNHIFRGLPRRAYPAVRDRFRSNVGIGQLRLTINNANGFARLGQLVMGRSLDIGLADASILRLGDVDYSEVAFNDYGDITRTVRPAAKVVTFGAKIQRDEMDFVANTLRDFRGGRPAVWTIGTNEKHGTTVYGFREQYTMQPDLGDDNLSDLSLPIQGLV